jgi:hypothetical protein
VSRTNELSKRRLQLCSEADERVFCQMLRRDDGRQLGFVVRYYEDGPTYAWRGSGASARARRP